MKRILFLMMAAIAVTTFLGCGKKDADKTEPEKKAAETTTSSVEPAGTKAVTAKTEAPKERQTKETADGMMFVSLAVPNME